RMCWYHLLPNALGSRIGDTWSVVGPARTRGIRAREIQMTVEEVLPEGLRLSLEGFVHLGNPHKPGWGPLKSQKDSHQVLGYEARLRGFLNFDRTKQAFTRFDIVALGDMYGDAVEDNWLFRPGRHPVGFSFELVGGTTPVDRLPPRGNLTRPELSYYLGLGKP